MMSSDGNPREQLIMQMGIIARSEAM